MPLYPSYIYSQKANQLFGTAVVAANVIEQVDASIRNAFITAAQGLALDVLPAAVDDLSQAGYAKGVGIVLSFTGTTPISLDFTAIATATGVTFAGIGTFVSSFATWSHFIFQNVSTSGTIAISPGASNPLRNPLGGTTPTFTLSFGDVARWNASATNAVDSTHKVLTFTPSAGGTLLIAAAGS